MAIEENSLEQLLEKINTIDTITSSDYYNNITYSTIPSLTIGTSSVDANITSSTGMWTTTHTGTSVTPNVTISTPTWTTANPYTVMGAGSATGATIGQGGKVSLQGEGADVEINGKSLKTWMERVEERLNILTPNPELEKEWDDLRKLGERYRKLEKKCKEKAEVWKKLKSMPPPDRI